VPNSTIYLVSFLLSDYKTTLPGLYFGIFEVIESFVLIPKKSNSFIISLKNTKFNCE
jgi:hypothetical protein